VPLPLPFWREGLTYKQPGLSQKDMDFLSQRKWNRRDHRGLQGAQGGAGPLRGYQLRHGQDPAEAFVGKHPAPQDGPQRVCAMEPTPALYRSGRIWAEFDYASISALQEDRRELVESAQKLWTMGGVPEPGQ